QCPRVLRPSQRRGVHQLRRCLHSCLRSWSQDLREDPHRAGNRRGQSRTTPTPRMTVQSPIRYLSRREVAERIGVKPDTLSRYSLPPPDALVGARKGWLPATIDEWNTSRPG